MKEKVIIVILLLILILNFVMLINVKSLKKSKVNDKFEQNIYQLNKKIDSLYLKRDTIYIKINELSNQLDSINNNYEQTCSIIYNNTIDNDYEFLTDYLKRFGKDIK